MATHFISRLVVSKALIPCLFRSLSTHNFLINRFRPLAGIIDVAAERFSPSVRCCTTKITYYEDRPVKRPFAPPGCDFKHWLVVVEPPATENRDEIIDSYIKIMAQVVGSEQEAKEKIYSVSTKCYYAFGALVNEEVSHKFKELEGVRWVIHDSYLDVQNKDYGGEPFINGQAVPYDPKYHKIWNSNLKKNPKKGQQQQQQKGQQQQQQKGQQQQQQKGQQQQKKGRQQQQQKGQQPQQKGQQQLLQKGQQQQQQKKKGQQQQQKKKGQQQQQKGQPNKGPKT